MGVETRLEAAERREAESRDAAQALEDRRRRVHYTQVFGNVRDMPVRGRWRHCFDSNGGHFENRKKQRYGMMNKIAEIRARQMPAHTDTQLLEAYTALLTEARADARDAQRRGRDGVTNPCFHSNLAHQIDQLADQVLTLSNTKLGVDIVSILQETGLSEAEMRQIQPGFEGDLRMFVEILMAQANPEDTPEVTARRQAIQDSLQEIQANMGDIANIPLPELQRQVEEFRAAVAAGDQAVDEVLRGGNCVARCSIRAQQCARAATTQVHRLVNSSRGAQAGAFVGAVFDLVVMKVSAVILMACGQHWASAAFLPGWLELFTGIGAALGAAIDLADHCLLGGRVDRYVFAPLGRVLQRNFRDADGLAWWNGRIGGPIGTADDERAKQLRWGQYDTSLALLNSGAARMSDLTAASSNAKVMLREAQDALAEAERTHFRARHCSPNLPILGPYFGYTGNLRRQINKIRDDLVRPLDRKIVGQMADMGAPRRV